MGLSSKQVSEDGFYWAKNLMQAGALELPNATPMRPQLLQSGMEPLKCPRCESTNTKFCYYNNYNRSQPRHFCKSCKRHWTKGGMLRNVPVGGGRKNKPLKPSKSPTKKSSKITKGAIPSQPQQQLPHGANDQKKFSEILYQSLLQPTSCLFPSSQPDCINNNLMGTALSLESLHPFPNLPSTTLSSFNYPPSFDSHFQLPIGLNYTGDDKPCEELSITTTATTMTPMPVHWQTPSVNHSRTEDSSSDWDWEDLNSFISTDVKQPWDDYSKKC